MIPITAFGLSYTNRCTAACRHCCVSASPRGRKKLDPRAVIRWLPELRRRGVRHLVFTGGEPLLFLGEIERISSSARSFGMYQTVFSNGSWAASPAAARRVARRIGAAGIDTVVLSTDEYHREFVPPQNVENAVKALRAGGVKPRILTLNVPRPLSPAPSLERGLLDRVGIAAYAIGTLSPEGRGKLLPERMLSFRVRPEDAVRRRCLTMNDIHVDAGGKVLRCCAIESNLRELDTEEFYCYGTMKKDTVDSVFRKLETFAAVHDVLGREGPGGLYRRLKTSLEQGGFALKGMYYAPCELCRSILGKRRFLAMVKDHFGIPPAPPKERFTRQTGVRCSRARGALRPGDPR